MFLLTLFNLASTLENIDFLFGSRDVAMTKVHPSIFLELNLAAWLNATFYHKASQKFIPLASRGTGIKTYRRIYSGGCFRSYGSHFDKETSEFRSCRKTDGIILKF